MPAHTIKAIQKIPAPLETVWEFFSNPSNLQNITPGNMGFKVISRHHGDRIYAGQIIEYYIRPFPGPALYWMTEITHVKPMELFIDEQRKGPYSLWHHQHHFKTIDGGTEMTDIVHYRNPFWLIGRLANSLFVKAQLRKIFSYRYEQVEKSFGTWPGSTRSLLIE